jgi:hypothetical protein
MLDDNPWVARNLYNAFVEAKRRSLERLLDPDVSRYPLAWLPTYARKMRDLFGGPGGEPQGSPVRFPGLPTRSVPPPFGSGDGSSTN